MAWPVFLVVFFVVFFADFFLLFGVVFFVSLISSVDASSSEVSADGVSWAADSEVVERPPRRRRRVFFFFLVSVSVSVSDPDPDPDPVSDSEACVASGSPVGGVSTDSVAFCSPSWLLAASGAAVGLFVTVRNSPWA